MVPDCVRSPRTHDNVKKACLCPIDPTHLSYIFDPTPEVPRSSSPHCNHNYYPATTIIILQPRLKDWRLGSGVLLVKTPSVIFTGGQGHKSQRGVAGGVPLQEGGSIMSYQRGLTHYLPLTQKKVCLRHPLLLTVPFFILYAIARALVSRYPHAMLNK